MPATLKVAHKAVGAEVRRGTYNIVLDGESIGSVDMNETFETPTEPGRHTLQVRSGRYSSRTKAFDAAEDEIIAFRCSGKGTVPIPGVGAVVFLLSFIFPSLALSLHRERRP
jgi:hypothetical protein